MAPLQTRKKILPDIPFSYQFLDEDFARMYRSEEQTGALLKIFTGMAVLVACLGLFGLAYFAASDWLNNFAYRTSIPTVFFIGALAISLTVGLITVLYKAIRAA